eukprot:scaffold20343_cov103-Isochrysis_galbana.AAC.2
MLGVLVAPSRPKPVGRERRARHPHRAERRPHRAVPRSASPRSSRARGTAARSDPLVRRRSPSQAARPTARLHAQPKLGRGTSPSTVCLLQLPRGCRARERPATSAATRSGPGAARARADAFVRAPESDRSRAHCTP